MILNKSVKILSMKEAILNYFRSDRSYNEGVILVMKYSHKLGFKRMLNLQHESDYLLGMVHEELRELAGINASEFMRLTRLPIVKQEIPAVSENIETEQPPVKIVPSDPKVSKQKAIKSPVKSPKKESRKK